jgi:hypothetical protein
MRRWRAACLAAVTVFGFGADYMSKAWREVINSGGGKRRGEVLLPGSCQRQAGPSGAYLLALPIPTCRSARCSRQNRA